MNIFENVYEQDFERFNAEGEKLKAELMPFADVIKVSDVDKVIKGFKEKTDDFFRNDRKLNIGIIGQVKAGKSTFLNTVLFNGEDVLPKAATPKTAGLTKIEYSEQNSIEIEYYTHTEWENLQALSQRDDKDDSMVTVAKEIMNMVARNGINYREYLDKGSEIVSFESSEVLMQSLNRYVGNDGTLTPLVKDVILRINNPELKDISVVDTPGLNDPILSRTQKTRDFMKKCDVVFFLSKANEFLSSSDLTLLSSQLPSEGVQRIILVCSQLDVIQVEDYDEDESFDEILADTKRRLTSHARAMFDSVMKSNEEHNRAGLNTVIASCKKPVFVSSMAYNMSKKAKADYDEQEKIVYASLNEYGALDEDESLLGKIGNMDEVRGLFDEVGRNKNETLKAKAMDFVPKTKLQLKVVLDKYAELVNSKLDVLKNNDRDAIEKQKDTVLKRKNAIVAEVEGIFGETLEGIETQKIETTNFLRNMQAESTKLEEHIEEKWISKQVRVSDSVWWNPFSWFSSHIEDRGYMEHTSYLDAADAVNNINDFIAQAQNEIESIFKDKVNTSAIKSKLIRSVVDNFDVADEKFDPNFFRIIVENNVSRISFPVINFNTDSIRSQVIDNFQGRVKDEAKANELRKALNKAISEVFSLTLTTMTNTVSEFRDKLFELKDEVSAGFIADITEEYNAILSQCEQKNNEIERLEQLLQLLDNANK